MLEKPDLDESEIIACLQQAYGLRAARISFLPLGADQGTAVYRAETTNGVSYFVRLRSGHLNEIAVVLPRFLSDQGIPHIIGPLPTKSGQLWAELDDFTVVLYPFIEGKDGYQVRILDQHWRDLGATVKVIHAAALPPAIAGRLRRETYSPEARQAARSFVEHAQIESTDDPVAAQTAALLRERREQILDLVGRAERLVLRLSAEPRPFVLCHSDLHAGNFLITANGSFYIVDWDEIIIAPKERDLMFIGGGVAGGWLAPTEEEDLFYQGYGPTQVDPVALAYYRYDRIVQDIAAFCEQILMTDAGGDDRAQSLRYLASNFEPGGVLEIAYRSDRSAPCV